MLGLMNTATPIKKNILKKKINRIKKKHLVNHPVIEASDQDDNNRIDVEFDDSDKLNTSSDLTSDSTLNTSSDSTLNTSSDLTPEPKVKLGELDSILLKAQDILYEDTIMFTDKLDNSTIQKKKRQPVKKPKQLVNNNNQDKYIEETDIDTNDDVQYKKPKKYSGKKIVKKNIMRKGPGRPRKTPKKEPIPRQGIVSTPGDDNNAIEFLYDTPVILKKIIAFFKSLASSQIQIIFRPDDIVFYAQDHHKKSKIRIKVDGSKLNHYYCSNIIDIGVNCKDLELTLNKVDKEYNSIIMLVGKGNTQKNIIIVMVNDIQIDESHTIDVVGQYNHMEDEEEFINEDYMIQFTLPGKYFRKTINDIKTMSHQLSIQQEDSDAPLEFGYNSPNKKIRSHHTFKNPDKVNFISNLDDESSFRVDIKVDYIKPIASAHIADKITIFVDENRKFMTKAYIDNGTIEIKTLTEIIDERPEEEQ